ncbi:glutathione S-transferase family protein [Sorangium sp. So ce291]|uniref:glutathione S-transferase family protein n=1 Tax=Sorangium sp. So ce291 TaxID=3133294 RepID=UPI003F5DEB77
MANITLHIGNKNYSSWSLIPWLALKQLRIDFEERMVLLREEGSKEQLRARSPSGKVPVLLWEDIKVWDSLAICEHLAERHPDARLWPDAPEARALARSVTCEIHSGFIPFRRTLPFNVRRHVPVSGLSPEVEADIARIAAMWEDCRQRFGRGGPFLFGHFTIADAFSMPAIVRFRNYALPCGDVCAAYVDAALSLPAMAEWSAAARVEPHRIPAFEIEVAS